MKDLIRILMSLLLPPLGVFFRVGFRAPFWINVILTLFGYIPGLVHSIWVIAHQSALEQRADRLTPGRTPSSAL